MEQEEGTPGYGGHVGFDSERVLGLVCRHSDRAICYYDIQRDEARAWDKASCAKCAMPGLCGTSGRNASGNCSVTAEGAEAMRCMLDEIKSGKESGGVKLHVREKDGKRRWVDIQYITVPGGGGRPEAALLMHKDITAQYKHELAYRFYVQSLAADQDRQLLFLDCDLTANSIDRTGGRLAFPDWFSPEMTYSELEEKLTAAGAQCGKDGLPAGYFSQERLLALFDDGIRNLKKDWKARFQDGSVRWMTADLVMMEDLYNGHVKAFFKAEDITEKKQEQIEIVRRSEQDGMTGLLNRTTAVAKIRKRLSDRRHLGILMILDLDNLKGINDVFGHNEGDRVIITIADTLREHFRESDIIARIGGDEFLLFLPGAASSIDTIVISLTELMKKLSEHSIGGCDEQRVRCSIGCAVQTKDCCSFSALYKQADKALYHVKRNGKDNFAIYQSEMDAENYRFQKHQLIAMKGDKKFEAGELQHLLSAVTTYFQLVLSINISSNSYFLMDEVTDGVFARLPSFGVLDSFVNLTESRIHPDDKEKFHARLSRPALKELLTGGKKSTRVTFRFMDADGTYRLTDALAIFYRNERGDMCDITFVRWADVPD